MPGIIEFPTLVQDALAQYGDLFANECQRRHFAEYLTGLFVAERKTVFGIHDEFAQTTDQSCLNRFLTEVPWDVQALNQRRLERLQEDPTTRYSDQGVIPIDNTLIDRDGQLIPDAGWFWDHAEERNKIAQDYLFVNYVCTSGKHYPAGVPPLPQAGDLRGPQATVPQPHRLVLRIDRLGLRAEDPRRLHLGQLLHQRRGPQPHPRQDGSVRTARGYVGDLKTNRKLEWKGRIVKASDLAASIPRRTARRLRHRATDGSGTSRRRCAFPR